MLWTAGLKVKTHGAAAAKTGLCEWKRHILSSTAMRGSRGGRGGESTGTEFNMPEQKADRHRERRVYFSTITGRM